MFSNPESALSILSLFKGNSNLNNENTMDSHCMNDTIREKNSSLQKEQQTSSTTSLATLKVSDSPMFNTCSSLDKSKNMYETLVLFLSTLLNHECSNVLDPKSLKSQQDWSDVMSRFSQLLVPMELTVNLSNENDFFFLFISQLSGMLNNTYFVPIHVQKSLKQKLLEWSEAYFSKMVGNKVFLGSYKSALWEYYAGNLNVFFFKKKVKTFFISNSFGFKTI